MQEFQNFSDDSRVWIYQADRPFSSAEAQRIQVNLDRFTATWDTHGKSLKAAGKVMHERFIVLIVDESAVAISGCSIDKSVHLMQALGKELGLDLFNRLGLAYWQGEEIKVGHKSELKKLVADGNLSPDTLVFNNLISSKKELETSWQIPLSESWAARFV